MASGAENIYPLPPRAGLPMGAEAPRTPGAGREGRKGGPDGEAALPAPKFGGRDKAEVERGRGTAHLGISGGTEALSPTDPPVGAR